MNPIDARPLGDVIAPDLALRITLTLAHFLWQGVVLGLVAVLVDRCLRAASARTRYGVFVGILLVMGAAPGFTYIALGTREPMSVVVSESPAAAVSLDITDDMAVPAPAVREPHSTPAAPPAINDLRPAAFRAPSAIDFASQSAAGDVANARGIESYARFVFMAYLCGTAAMLARLALGLFGGRRLRLAATPIPDGPIVELVVRQANRLGLKTAPLIAWCGRISVPVVVGILRPMILLPATLATGFDPSQLAALITHELAHIRRFDPLVNLLQRLIEVVLFFHPAV
jgi:Zn-dependent protease with chaperone function